MSSNIFDFDCISYNDLFLLKDNYTFLVGAGISKASPSCLPLANEIINVLLDNIVPRSEKDTIAKSNLRFEKIIEVLKINWDKELKLFDFFEAYQNIEFNHNLIHTFLARMIKNGNYVITTNFDSLIERALDKESIAPKEMILPIITLDDYKKYSNPDNEIFKIKYPIFKLHGSIRNYIDNTTKDTKDTLITTISSFCQHAADKTFAIGSYKKPVINNIIKNRTLIIMGYSGGDEFDIIPTLKELSGYNSIIWINHVKELSTIQVYKLKKNITLPKSVSN